MRKVLGLVGATLLFAGPALGADLGRPPPYKAPPLVPVFSWTGWYIGAHGGYGWSHMPDLLDVKGTGGFGGGALPVTATANQDLNYLGTVRGRLGYTITPTLLVYGTGGFAYGGAEVSSSVNTTPGCPGFCGGLTSSSTLTGWAAGGGLEYMISPNWTAKLEYLHYDLGSLSQTFGDSFGRFPGTFVNTSTNFKGDIVRIGANYKF